MINLGFVILCLIKILILCIDMVTLVTVLHTWLTYVSLQNPKIQNIS